MGFVLDNGLAASELGVEGDEFAGLYRLFDQFKVLLEVLDGDFHYV